MYGKSCLVTGANGFLGRQLCSQLKAEGWHITALLHTPATGSWDEALLSDLSRPLILPPGTFRHVDVVFHLAGIAHQAAAEWLYEAVNHQATLALARQSMDEGCARFVFVSSTLAAGALEGAIPVTERQIAWPVDPYGVSKRRAEEDLRLSYGASVTIVRPPLIYGAGVKGNLRSMMHAVRAGWFPPPPVAGVRSMVSVRDAARAITVVADAPQAAGQLFYITDDEIYTARRLYDAMRAVAGLPVRRWAVPNMAFRLAGKIGDAISALGVSAPVTGAMVNRLLDHNLFSTQHIHQMCGWKATEKFEDVLPDMMLEIMCD